MVRILILSSLVIGGCGGSKFDAPWDEANALPDAVDGTFEALIGDRVPGSASGTIAGEEVQQLVRVAVHEVEGTWPVVQLELMDRTADGWRVIELDVSQDAWVAGSIPVDGTAAIGQLRDRDGSERFLLGGTIELTRAGLAPGERVSGSFSNVQLAEVR